jgi:spore maturation protein CgeB
VAWLRDHPRERAAIAAAGQRRALKDHTFASRVDELLGELRSRL